MPTHSRLIETVGPERRGVHRRLRTRENGGDEGGRCRRETDAGTGVPTCVQQARRAGVGPDHREVVGRRWPQTPARLDRVRPGQEGKQSDGPGRQAAQRGQRERVVWPDPLAVRSNEDGTSAGAFDDDAGLRVAGAA
jgi:hypothetical protein